MDLDLSKIKNVHFIGIGGIGISAIARMMLFNDKKVSGQDMQEGEVVEELRKIGADITIGQSYKNIPDDVDLIVYTIAIDTYDPELAKSIKEYPILHKNIDGQVVEVFVLSYPQMLDVISRDKYTIAISGTHGKTTTTAMIAQILIENGNDPTVVVGSLLVGSKSNFIGGTSKYLVVEACEYRRSFLKINPKILIITNIEEDHLDYYKDIEDIKSAFHEMALKVPSNGFVICNPDDKNISDVIKGVKAEIVNYDKFFNNNLKLKIPGIHNKKDAAAAIATAVTLNITREISEKYVSNFPGTWRRFEFKGILPKGTIVYDDYAHHPTEIMATLQGFQELYPKSDGWRVTVVFQPHLFSRTKLLLKDFAKSFNDCYQAMLLPIYYAREVDDGTISSKILADEINKNTKNALAFERFDLLEEDLIAKIEKMNEKDIIVTMGAGEAFKVGDFILNR